MLTEMIHRRELLAVDKGELSASLGDGLIDQAAASD
jgi:hypothetical protein